MDLLIKRIEWLGVQGHPVEAVVSKLQHKFPEYRVINSVIMQSSVQRAQAKIRQSQMQRTLYRHESMKPSDFQAYRDKPMRNTRQSNPNFNGQGFRSRSANTRNASLLFDENAPMVDITPRKVQPAASMIASPPSSRVPSSRSTSAPRTPLYHSQFNMSSAQLNTVISPESQREITKATGKLEPASKPLAFWETRPGGFQISQQVMKFNTITLNIRHTKMLFVAMQRGYNYCPKFSIRCSQGKELRLSLKKNGDFYVMTVEILLQRLGAFEGTITFTSLKEQKQVKVVANCVDGQEEAGDVITFSKKIQLIPRKAGQRTPSQPSGDGCADDQADKLPDSPVLNSSVVHMTEEDPAPSKKQVVTDDFIIGSQLKNRMEHDTIAWNCFVTKISSLGSWDSKDTWLEEGMAFIQDVGGLTSEHLW